MKEHEIREVVNRCRDIAVEYAHSQQLREVLGAVIKDAMEQQYYDGYDAGVKAGESMASNPYSWK